MKNNNLQFGFNKETLLTILAIVSLVPYQHLPKILQDLKNVLESVNPVKRLYDWINSMSEEAALQNLEVGDHIYCYRENFYSHHGIYAGNGKVWEYDGKTIEDAEIKLSSLHTFSNGTPINRLNYQADFSPKEILERAESRKFEANYNLISNNCMHFAFWCRLATVKDREATEQVFTLLLNAGKSGEVQALN
ncbi:MAG: lecithin retinol acyltransferase family protein [Phascolarctobacterium sp.]|nr:lecithin retinol acyltransferase family protein [Candidatus Phascolarctobacterium caballi]